MKAFFSRRFLLAAFAFTQAILYACVLPLFEGFDEPFHFGYVESLVRWHGFPVVKESPVSREIEQALTLTPLSRLLSETIPGSTSFEQWAGMSERDRQARRAKLWTIPERWRSERGTILNYEAQQTPLAYLLLAPPDWALGRMALPARVLALRLLAALAAAWFLLWGLDRLGRELGLQGAFLFGAIAFVLQTQMLWASMAHVGNDALAIPLTIWFLVSLVVAAKRPEEKNLLVLGGLLAAGLLAKAYFLAFLPLVCVFLLSLFARRYIPATGVFVPLALVLLVDGPWYLRNVLLYGSISGTQQSAAGIGFQQALAAVPRIGWLQSIPDFARWSLWTGNWSFTSFSQGTLNFELMLLLGAFAAYLLARARPTGPERWVLLASALFGLSLIYQTCATWVESHGVSTHPEPWYGQGMLACLVLLCFKGLQRAGRAGSFTGIVLTLTAAWISVLTYLAKLLPYYGGAITRSNFNALARWWGSHPDGRLGLVLPVHPRCVYVLLGIFVLLLGAITAQQIREALMSRGLREVRLRSLEGPPPHPLP